MPWYIHIIDIVSCNLVLKNILNFKACKLQSPFLLSSLNAKLCTTYTYVHILSALSTYETAYTTEKLHIPSKYIMETGRGGHMSQGSFPTGYQHIKRNVLFNIA